MDILHFSRKVLRFKGYWTEIAYLYSISITSFNLHRAFDHRYHYKLIDYERVTSTTDQYNSTFIFCTEIALYLPTAATS